MSKEKPYSSQSWRTAVSELTSLPGEDLYDVNNGWEKLSARLPGKKRNSKVILYWIAAACICACITGSWIWMNTNKETVIPNTVRAEKTIYSIEPLQPITELTISAETLKSKVLKNQHAGSATVRKISSTALPVITIAAPVVEINSINNDSITSINVVYPPVKSKSIVFTALKKRIPVVHINDLEQPINHVEEVAGNNDRSFRIRVFNRNIPQPFPDNTDPGDLLKIKISPQN